MYFETVDWATSKPSIRSSPWIRDAPPQWVFPAHPLDEISQAAIDLRPPCPILRLPTPEHFETSAMPPQDRRRLNYLSKAE
jgi:hypothetical protein